MNAMAPVNYTRLAMATLEKMAAINDAEALCEMGYRFYIGEGFAADPSRAFHLTEMAYQKGSLRAQRNLGVFYYKGVGVDVDRKKAAEHTQAAANKGDVRAQFNMGLLYAYGDEAAGIVRDDTKAFNLVWPSAQDDFALAAYFIGLFYLEGRGADRRIGKGISWLRHAAYRGEPRALQALGFADGKQSDKDAPHILAYYEAAQRALSRDACVRIREKVGEMIKSPQETLSEEALATVNERLEQIGPGPDIGRWLRSRPPSPTP